MSALSTLKPPLFGQRRERVLKSVALWRENALVYAMNELTKLELDLRQAMFRSPESHVERVLLRLALQVTSRTSR